MLCEVTGFFRQTQLQAAEQAAAPTGNGRVKAMSALRKGLELGSPEEEPLLFCSAKTGAGLKELWSTIFANAVLETT